MKKSDKKRKAKKGARAARGEMLGPVSPTGRPERPSEVGPSTATDPSGGKRERPLSP